MRSILKLFAKDPFEPLQSMMVKIADCCLLVPELIDSLEQDDPKKIKTVAARIAKLEHEVDMIKNTVRSHLPKSIFLPVDRRDLLDVIAKMDYIPDIAEDIGRLFTVRKMEYPQVLHKPMKEFTQKSVDCVIAAAEVVKSLDHLVEAGFSGPSTKQFVQLIDKVGQVEHDGDLLQTELVGIIFSLESEISPVGLLVWIKIINKIGDLANASERMVNRLRMFTDK